MAYSAQRTKLSRNEPTPGVTRRPSPVAGTLDENFVPEDEPPAPERVDHLIDAKAEKCAIPELTNLLTFALCADRMSAVFEKI